MHFTPGAPRPSAGLADSSQKETAKRHERPTAWQGAKSGGEGLRPDGGSGASSSGGLAGWQRLCFLMSSPASLARDDGIIHGSVASLGLLKPEEQGKSFPTFALVSSYASFVRVPVCQGARNDEALLDLGSPGRIETGGARERTRHRPRGTNEHQSHVQKDRIPVPRMRGGQCQRARGGSSSPLEPRVRESRCLAAHPPTCRVCAQAAEHGDSTG